MSIRKGFIGIIAIILAAGAWTTAIHAQSPSDPEQVIRGVVDAFNRGDAAAAAAYFAEDATLTCPPPADVCRGRAAIQAQLEHEIAEGTQVTFRGISVEGDTVTAQVTETAPGLAELGLERIYANLVATVRDGTITELAEEFDLSDAQTAQAAAALAELEETGLPAAGTGYHEASSGVPGLVLAVVGVSVVVAGGVALRRQRSR